MAGPGIGGAAEAPQVPGRSAMQRASWEPPQSEAPTLEISFATAQRFAIITELRNSRQRLYAVGDCIADPREPTRRVQIQQIESTRLQLRDSQTQRVLWITEGAVVPGFPSRRFAGTATLRGIDRRYVATVAPLDPEPRLLHIQGDRALLEVDVPSPRPLAARPRSGEAVSRPKLRDLGPFERVRIKETQPDNYEISSAELRDALNHGGRLLAEEWPQVAPLVSIQTGISLQVKSPVAEGTISPHGFRVTDPRLVGQAGIQAGDVILSINGLAVNSFGDLFLLYMQAVRQSHLSDVEVQLERNGALVTKIYRVR
ncbi:MAG TPA: hypothetical protein VMG58_02240 [Candidatus Sulfotelmatobacter sp.]|nr:hypothetical protein [Candidatus Sulfotelmatobacter sp.]